MRSCYIGSHGRKHNHFRRFDFCLYREILIQLTLKFLYIIHQVKSLKSLHSTGGKAYEKVHKNMLVRFTAI